MKLSILILAIAIFAGELTNAQIYPSDSIRFIRYSKDSEKKISIPLTALFYLRHTSFKSRAGWVSERSLQADSLKDLILIEMNSTDVPPGVWGDYTPGSFLLAFEFGKGTKEIRLDSMNEKMNLLNNYATSGENNPINIATGLLKLETKPSGQVVMNGTIKIDSKKPVTKHEIIFNNAVVPTTDYKGYVKSEKEYWASQQEHDKKMFDLTDRIAKAETEFYDSLFTYKLFPDNQLKANMKGSKPFDFILDRSYIVKGADISEAPSENLMDLLGSNIYYPIPGNCVIMNLHCFFEGEKNIIDDETNYSLLLALPDLVMKDYVLNKNKNVKAKLAYWHYGPTGHVIESKSVAGKMTITKIENKTVWGSLNLEFKSTDKRIFNLTGVFQLPVIEKEAFNKLGQKIKNITKE
ncbi:MAG TPA: hypothetical protein VIH57_15635 [Bacteroidales bacterium]